MIGRGRAAAVVWACLLAATSLAAAPQPKRGAVIDDPEAKLALDPNMVAELVVRPDGPVWWTVSRGRYRVRILGVLWYYPQDAAWNQHTLDRRIDRASSVALPPAMIVTRKQAAEAADQRLPPDVLPQDLATRLAKAAGGLGLPVERYAQNDAITAGLLLVTDHRARWGLEAETLVKTIEAVAKRHIRPAAASAQLQARSPIGQWKDTALEGRLACLEAALEEVEAGPAPIQAAVAGWASGDLVSALEMPRGIERCDFVIPGQADLRRKAIDAQVRFVSDTLNPGTQRNGGAEVVMVVGLRSLLAEGGVLDRLRKAGYTVTSSADDI